MLDWEEYVNDDGTENFYCTNDSARVQVAMLFVPEPCFLLRVRHREYDTPFEVGGCDTAGMLGVALRSMGLPLPEPLQKHYAAKGYRELTLDDRPASRSLAAELMKAVAEYRNITGSEKVGDAYLTRSERQRLICIGNRAEWQDPLHIRFSLWNEQHSPVVQYVR